MHSYTAVDVEADGFDLSLIKVDQADIDTMVDAITKEKELLGIKAKALNPAYPWIDTRVMAKDMKLFCEVNTISMMFDKSFMMSLTKALDGNNMVYPSWTFLSEIYTMFSKHPKLAQKAFYCSSIWSPLKDHIINSSHLSCDEMLKLVKDQSVIKLQETGQLKLLELCDGADAPVFFGSDYEKIRLAAYKKHGPALNVDAMIADSNWTVRQYAIGILSPGDKRLASFISDKSLNVFCAALQKIDPGLMLMMVGSYHMKKARAKDIVKPLLDSGT